MAGSASPKLDSKASQLKPEAHTFKKRKVVEKTIVTVRIGANDEEGKQIKNEGAPSDCWSWRKYGQKPIKGSPYPRNYYRCSTSKGCSAKKQVEISKTDASLLVITYTSGHNHPGPDLHNPILTTQTPDDDDDDSRSQLMSNEDDPTASKHDQEVQNETVVTRSDHEDVSEERRSFHYMQSSPEATSSQDIMISTQQEFLFTKSSERTHWGMSFLSEDQEALSFSRSKSEENYDFFDELEELIPMSSSAFTSFMSGNLFSERIPVVPS